LIVASLAGWAFLGKHKESFVAQTAVLDLRNRSRARGTERPPDEPPLEIPRTVSHLEIYLPLGSTDGSYDLRVSTLNGHLLFSGKGVARIEQGATVLPVDVNLRSVDPALYVLQVQQNGAGWNSYPLRIK
jgi:hypothetical protein